MAILVRIATLPALVLLFAACTGGSERGTPDDARGLSDAEALVRSYVDAVEARDTASVRAMFVDDGRFEWVEDGRVQYDAPDAVIAGISALPRSMTIRTEYEGLELTALGERGARASTGFSTVMEQDGATFGFGGVITMVLEAGPGGWRIVSGHTSTVRDRGPEG